MRRIIFLQLLAAVGFHLRFTRRHDGIGVRAEQNVPQTLRTDKRGRGAFDAQLLKLLPANTLEFIRGK